MAQHHQTVTVVNLEVQHLRLSKQLQTVLKDLKVLDLVQLLMEHQMVKVQIRRNLETKMVRRQMVLIKLKKATNNCQ